MKKKKKLTIKPLKQFHCQIKQLRKLRQKKKINKIPDKLDEEVKQVSEFEKKEFVDLDNIAKLIDKAKEDTAEID